jgi:hypothetical protein
LGCFRIDTKKNKQFTMSGWTTIALSTLLAFAGAHPGKFDPNCRLADEVRCRRGNLHRVTAVLGNENCGPGSTVGLCLYVPVGV